jgi:hypothetical protein
MRTSVDRSQEIHNTRSCCLLKLKEVVEEERVIEFGMGQEWRVYLRST